MRWNIYVNTSDVMEAYSYVVPIFITVRTPFSKGIIEEQRRDDQRH